MTAFESYKMYVAVKLHFTTDSYDYFKFNGKTRVSEACLLYTSPSPRDYAASRMPSSA